MKERAYETKEIWLSDNFLVVSCFYEQRGEVSDAKQMRVNTRAQRKAKADEISKIRCAKF